MEDPRLRCADVTFEMRDDSILEPGDAIYIPNPYVQGGFAV